MDEGYSIGCDSMTFRRNPQELLQMFKEEEGTPESEPDIETRRLAVERL